MATTLPLLLLAGCTSTQEKAERLAAEGQEAFTEKGLSVKRVNPDVKVVERAVVTDRNGTAAVVVLRNRAKRAQVGLPVAIDVRGANKRSVFRNDAAGLEPSLTTVPVITPGRTVAWVNDQVTASARPSAVQARVGISEKRAPRAIPVLRLSGVRVRSEGAIGIAATGRVRNESKVEQRDLVLYGVARKGERIVAAGRGQIRRVRPGARASFRMFFIGDPRGADLDISVPPTRLTN